MKAGLRFSMSENPLDRLRVPYIAGEKSTVQWGPWLVSQYIEQHQISLPAVITPMTRESGIGIGLLSCKVALTVCIRVILQTDGKETSDATQSDWIQARVLYIVELNRSQNKSQGLVHSQCAVPSRGRARTDAWYGVDSNSWRTMRVA